MIKLFSQDRFIVNDSLNICVSYTKIQSIMEKTGVGIDIIRRLCTRTTNPCRKNPHTKMISHENAEEKYNFKYTQDGILCDGYDYYDMCC